MVVVNRSASSPLRVPGCPLSPEVLEGQDLHLVVPEGGLVVVLLGGGLRVRFVGYLQIVLLESALQGILFVTEIRNGWQI